MYNAALTQAQIQTDMATPIGGSATVGHPASDGAEQPHRDGDLAVPDQPLLDRIDG